MVDFLDADFSAVSSTIAWTWAIRVETDFFGGLAVGLVFSVGPGSVGTARARFLLDHFFLKSQKLTDGVFGNLGQNTTECLKQRTDFGTHVKNKP